MGTTPATRATRRCTPGGTRACSWGAPSHHLTLTEGVEADRALGRRAHGVVASGDPVGEGRDQGDGRGVEAEIERPMLMVLQQQQPCTAARAPAV